MDEDEGLAGEAAAGRSDNTHLAFEITAAETVHEHKDRHVVGVLYLYN